MRRILFSADGSSGDLLPMVLMAREFQAAGYDVCVCGSSEFSKMAEDFGVPFEGYPHSYSEIYLDRQRTGYLYNIREAIRHQEMLYQGEYELLSKIAPQYDLIVNFLAELMVPSIAQAFEIPNIKLFTFPMVDSTVYGLPTGLPFITEARWLNRLQWWAGTHAATHLFKYGRTLNRLRGELGLPPSRNLLRDNGRYHHMMMGVYEELMPPDPIWHDYTYIGPCIPSDPVPLSDELEAFLAAGPKPIYIGFGSMRHANGDQLTHTLLQAVEENGVRAVIAQAGSSIGSGLDEAENVYVLREYPIPHHVLFPRLAGAVHHGSWITTHLAARAGIPQMVMPQATDQFLWAHVVKKNGLGPKGVDMNRLTARKLSAGIAELVGRPEYESNARELGERVAGIDGPKNALRLIETLDARGSLRPGGA